MFSLGTYSAKSRKTQLFPFWQGPKHIPPCDPLFRSRIWDCGQVEQFGGWALQCAARHLQEPQESRPSKRYCLQLFNCLVGLARPRFLSRSLVMDMLFHDSFAMIWLISKNICSSESWPDQNIDLGKNKSHWKDWHVLVLCAKDKCIYKVSKTSASRNHHTGWP